jgi:3-methylfumaryl-CoA hydratase
MSADFKDWIGRSETRQDIVSPSSLARFHATLNYDAASEAVPQGLHWCLGLPQEATQNLGADGHPPLGDFMPPLDFPRRMWAASEVDFIKPLAVDMAVERISTIASITPKAGKSGDMVFVELSHETKSEGAIHIRETQTIVYRDHPKQASPLPPITRAPDVAAWDWSETITPSAQLLFRYSALTFNTHRIHYDQAYASGTELYPALVVHGPLTASLLLKLCADNLGAIRLAQFSYRALAPLYVDQPIYLTGRIEGDSVSLCAFGGDGRVGVEASGRVSK